ncbi:hypothetical protein HZA85_02380 [Candidatus Uhrbacteria bacterium]|nr:hypothetical protein [Candidatus Uhrbacteria bacterium]
MTPRIPTFDASTRQATASWSLEFADHWFLEDGKDLTLHNGISYGGLLRLPVFLSMCEGRESGNERGPWCRLIRSLVAALWKCAHLCVRTENAEPLNHPRGRTFAFLLAKHAPYGAIAKTLDPVVQSLSERGEKVCVFTFDAGQCRALQSRYPKLPCVNLTKGSVPLKQVWSLLCMLGQTTIKLLSSKKRIQMLEPLCQLLFHAPRFLQIEAALKTELHEDMVVISATEMHPFERLILTRAKQQHLRTILIQHGVTNETTKNLVVNTPSIVSSLFVWGSCAKQYFVNHGVDENRITITGSPALTPLFSAPKKGDREQRLAQFSLPDQHFILFSGQHFDLTKNAALCMLVLNAHRQFTSRTSTTWKLLITPHPAKSPYDAKNFFENLVRDHGLKLEHDVFIRSATSNINDLLELPEVLITSSSTLHVEAALQGIPVILLNIDEVADMDMVTLQAAWSAHNAQELALALESQTDPHTQTLIRSHIPTFLKTYVNYPEDAVGCITDRLLRLNTK